MVNRNTTTLDGLMVCVSCAAELPTDARFCPACGAPIFAADTSSDEERRVVTVLFADLVGFTSLSEGRDPEQVKRLIDSAFELLVADVESHGGVVDKLLGDAIVALFGAPVAHEDDAERAVRAGLAMQRTLARFREENPADELQIRVGVNTGEVVVGTLAGTDYTAMGDVVNTASRLQTLARPGAVLVGDETRALCSTALRFSAAVNVQLRGREQQTQAWEVVAFDQLSAQRRWESDVPFVGRRAELDMLGAVTDLMRSGRSAIVSLSGEAGIGKSRLVGEIVAPLLDVEPNTLVLEGACAPYGESNVWWPVAGGVLRRLGLHRDSSPEEAREQVRASLPHFAARVRQGTPAYDRVVELTMHLLGHPSTLDDLGPAATRDVVFSGLATALQRRSVEGPVVIWLEDLQWASPLLLELLEFLARRLARSPLLVLTTCRLSDEAAHDWPPSIEAGLNLHLALRPLDDDDSVAVVGQVAGRDLSDEVVQNISSRSGGNPLFLIELARLTAASGCDDPGSELPGSMRALIAARLDQLTPSQRSMVDNAAIIGNEGDIGSLGEFAAELGQTFDRDDLAQIEARGLMVRESGHWRFRSDVVREVAYHTLTKQVRAQRHAGIARHLAAKKMGAVDRRAHHAATAAEIVGELGPVVGVPTDITDEAVQLLRHAAERWYLQGAHRRGVRTARRGLRLAEAGSSESLALLLLLAEGLVETHRVDQARSVLADAFEQAEAAGDRVSRGEIFRLRGQIEQMGGDLIAARRELGLAVAEFRDLGDEPHLAESLRVRGFAEVFGGSLADGDRFLQQAEEIFERLGDARGHAWVQQHLAWVSFLAGNHDESMRRLQTSIAAFEKSGDRAGRTWSLGLLAYVHHFNRRDDEALALAASVLDEARRWDDDWGASMMLNLQATIRLWSGDPAEARKLADRALDGFRKIDDRFGVIQVLATQNRAHVALGSVAEAERSSEEVLALSESFGNFAYPTMAAAGTAMHLGRGQRTVELAARAVEMLDSSGANLDEARVLVAFGQLLSGDADRALADLLEVDVESSPMALAARATARAAIGDRAGAVADAARVDELMSPSYWDAAVALIAGAAAASGGDGADAWVDRLRHLVATIDDSVIHAYAQAVLSGLGDDAVVDSAHLLGGWGDVAAVMTAPQRTPAR